jgi:hypothetical protein
MEADNVEAARVADTVITVTLTEAEGVSEIAAPAPADAAGYVELLSDIDLTVGVREGYGNGRRLPHGISGVEFVDATSGEAIAGICGEAGGGQIAVADAVEVLMHHPDYPKHVLRSGRPLGVTATGRLVVEVSIAPRSAAVTQGSCTSSNLECIASKSA